MKFNWKMTAAAGAVLSMVAACGGGGGSAPAVPSVSLSGTAATGLALASGTVTVKCAKGDGSATTDSAGKYGLVIADAALPCMIQVTGDAGGTTITLHSVAQAGTANGSDTAAVANVTPLTEMVVAQLTGALPASVFETFGNASQITTEQLNAATSAVVSALKEATGIDLGTIDPFKSSLVAATAGAPESGNAYDKLLDAFGEKVPPQALDQIVNQIASAASSANGNGPVTLKDVMAAVDGGALPGCPTAMSGKYRRLDYFGRSGVWKLDFKAMTMTSGDGATVLALTADPTQACQFQATNGTTGKLDIAMSASGMGAFRGENLVTGDATTGFLFPVQAPTFAATQGEWTFLQSGYMPGDGIRHFPGRITVNADRSTSTCDYDASFQCVPESTVMSVADRSDGGFDLVESGSTVANVYAYRAPSGAVTLFGTTNAAGTRDAAVEQTSFVATKLAKATLPAVGTTTKYWDIVYNRSGSSNITAPVASDATTVLSVDSDTGNVLRERASDGRQDTFRWNYPLDGLRTRQAGTVPTRTGTTFVSGAYQMQVPSLGINISINSASVDGTSAPGHFYSVSVVRP